MAEFLKIAELDENQVAQIKNLENSLGSHIMAYQSGLDLSNLTETQVLEVKKLEKQLGVILIAYEG